MKYSELYQDSINNKEAFWAKQATAINWLKHPTNTLSVNEKGFYQWFTDQETIA
jgi:hypothetical protein